MSRQITEKYQDGKLVERIIIEDGKDPYPIIPEQIWPTPWWGIFPPWHGEQGKTTSTTELKTEG